MLTGGLLTLDCNTKRVGVACGGPTDAAPRLFSWQLYGCGDEDTLARSCAALYRNIVELAKFVKPAMVIYEAPFNPQDGDGRTNHQAIRGLLSLAAITMAAGQNIHARTLPAHVATWRKHFIGNGYPKDPKKVTLDQCQRYGWSPKNDDEGDAAGMWHYGMSQFFKNPELPCAPLFVMGGAR